MRTNILFTITAIFIFSSYVYAQDRNDKANYAPVITNSFWDKIKKDSDSFKKNSDPATPAKKLQMDYTGVDIPKSINEFTIVEAAKPESQGITGTCWCFSATSFYEAEAYRLYKKNIQLSELYTVYWQYVEKAKYYVATRGQSHFDEGSETNAVQEMMKKYGIVSLQDYSGLQSGQPFHDHAKMVAEMKSYLKSIKEQNGWNETEIISTIKAIMNHYMGVPPQSVSENGKLYTPLQYLQEVIRINPDDYVTLMSLKSEPFWQKAEYKVDDNWWHSTNYYNIPVADFINAIKNAIKSGYSVSLGGDVSESGINSKIGVMMVPSYDIPSTYINDDARLLRFSNGATTDDHAIHLVGYAERSNGMWFLVKDSGAGGFNNGNNPGYWYVHEDYIKLKIMTATMHKDAVKNLLSKFM